MLFWKISKPRDCHCLAFNRSDYYQIRFIGTNYARHEVKIVLCTKLRTKLKSQIMKPLFMAVLRGVARNRETKR